MSVHAAVTSCCWFAVSKDTEPAVGGLERVEHRVVRRESACMMRPQSICTTCPPTPGGRGGGVARLRYRISCRISTRSYGSLVTKGSTVMTTAPPADASSSTVTVGVR
jgi:hypothetical protein